MDGHGIGGIGGIEGIGENRRQAINRPGGDP